jgi:hypothetical protein
VCQHAEVRLGVCGELGDAVEQGVDGNGVRPCPRGQPRPPGPRWPRSSRSTSPARPESGKTSPSRARPPRSCSTTLFVPRVDPLSDTLLSLSPFFWSVPDGRGLFRVLGRPSRTQALADNADRTREHGDRAAADLRCSGRRRCDPARRVAAAAARRPGGRRPGQCRPRPVPGHARVSLGACPRTVSVKAGQLQVACASSTGRTVRGTSDARSCVRPWVGFARQLATQAGLAWGAPSARQGGLVRADGATGSGRSALLTQQANGAGLPEGGAATTAACASVLRHSRAPEFASV